MPAPTPVYDKLYKKYQRFQEANAKVIRGLMGTRKKVIFKEPLWVNREVSFKSVVLMDKMAEMDNGDKVHVGGLQVLYTNGNICNLLFEEVYPQLLIIQYLEKLKPSRARLRGGWPPAWGAASRKKAAVGVWSGLLSPSLLVGREHGGDAVRVADAARWPRGGPCRSQ